MCAVNAVPAYAAGVLAALPITLLALALAGPQRRAAAWSGALMGGWGFGGGLFAADYWAPERLSGGVWGIEDVAFNVQLGVLVWVAGSLPWRRRLLTVLHPAALLRRAAMLTLPALGALLLAVGSGMSSMTATAMLAGLLLLATSADEPWRLRLAALGAAAYAAFYLPALALLVLACPEIYAAWIVGSAWAEPLLLDLPTGEVVWATLCAAAHAAAFAWTAQARLVARHLLAA